MYSLQSCVFWEHLIRLMITFMQLLMEGTDLSGYRQIFRNIFSSSPECGPIIFVPSSGVAKLSTILHTYFRNISFSPIFTTNSRISRNF